MTYLHGRRVLASWPGPGGTYHALEGCGLPTFIYHAKDTTMTHPEPEAVHLLRRVADPALGDHRPIIEDVRAYLARRDTAVGQLADLPAPTGWTEQLLGLGASALRAFWRHTGARADPDRGARFEGQVDHFDVRVTVADLASLPDGAEVIVRDCTGSILDHREGVPVDRQAEGLVWLVLGNLLDAASDPAEFWQSAMGDEPNVGSPDGMRRAAQVLDVLRFAQAHGAAIAPHADAVRQRTS